MPLEIILTVLPSSRVTKAVSTPARSICSAKVAGQLLPSVSKQFAGQLIDDRLRQSLSDQAVANGEFLLYL